MEKRFAYRSRLYLVVYLISCLSFIPVVAWLIISLCNHPIEENKRIIIAMLVVSCVVVLVFGTLSILDLVKKRIAIEYDENGIVINNKKKISLSFDEIEKCLYRAQTFYLFNMKIEFGTVYVVTKDKEYKVDPVRKAKQITLELNDLKESYMKKKQEITSE